MRFPLFLLLFGALGAGLLDAKVLPVLNAPASVEAFVGDTDTSIDLDTVFGTEDIDNSVVRFVSNFGFDGIPFYFDVALFSTRAPIARANFLDYVTDGDYVNSLLQRSVPGFVVQGGSYIGNAATNTISPVPLDPAIQNEFGISNTLGTVSNSKKGGFPNSAQAGWFINTGNNTDKLDPQNGGFTVFGRITASTLGNVSNLANPNFFPPRDLSPHLGGGFTDTPIVSSFSGSGIPPVSNFIRFPSVYLAPIFSGDAGESTLLSYSIAGQSNTDFVTPTLDGSILTLSYTPGLSGSTTVAVIATDSVGNIVVDSIEVNINDTYARWRAANWSEPELSNDSVSGPAADPNDDGVTNLELFVTGRSVSDGKIVSPVTSTTVDLGPGNRFIQFDVPRRNNVGVNFSVEKSTDLKNWSTTPVTIIDSAPFPASSLTVFQIRVNAPVSAPCQYRVRWDLVEE